MRPSTYKSPNYAVSAVVAGNPIPVTPVSPHDFPDSVKSELRRALKHASLHQIVLVADYDPLPVFTIETRAECRSWLQADSLHQLAQRVQYSATGPNELLVLLISSKDTGLRVVRLSDVLGDDEEPNRPSWSTGAL